MAPLPRIIFRADGNARIGLGHLTRCLALADMLAPEFAAVFVVRAPTAAVAATGAALWAMPADLPLAEEPQWLHARISPDDIVVLDDYGFTAAYQLALKQRPQPVVCLDDLTAEYVWADMLINQAGGLPIGSYRRAPGTVLCLGPQYALLRRPFREAAQQAAGPPTGRRVFLNMGGADPDNHTARVLHQLRQQLPDCTVDVVLGSAYPHRAALEREVQPWGAQVRIHQNLDAAAMAALMAACSVKVCPPSGVAYECCAVGGLVLLHPIADNQRRLFDYLTAEGLARPLTDLPRLALPELPALAAAMHQRQRAVFDGQAATRFRRAFHELRQTYQLAVRRAAPDDVHQYFEWANDADVRRNAVHTEPIAWEQHQTWFAKRVRHPAAHLYVFALHGEAVGQVRVEFDGAEGVIDYSVAAPWRGRGLGLAVLRRALLALRHDRPAPWTLTAHVKAGNLPSRRVFERLGFVAQPAVTLGAHPYDVFQLAFEPPA